MTMIPIHADGSYCRRAHVTRDCDQRHRWYDRADPRAREALRHHRYAASYPAVSQSDDWEESVVTQGHADYCRDYGHAHAVNGVCARCGEVLEA